MAVARAGTGNRALLGRVPRGAFRPCPPRPETARYIYRVIDDCVLDAAIALDLLIEPCLIGLASHATQDFVSKIVLTDDSDVALSQKSRQRGKV